MKVLLALSGGVDSSVAAHLLQEQGHEVVGIQFSLWNDSSAPASEQIMPKKCCNAQAIARAKHVAKDLNIEFHHIDVSEEFKEKIVEPFLDAYSSGLTPNPCVRCNRIFKTAKLLEYADMFGCEMVATGHYARIMKDPDDICHLHEAIDSTKDQSYFLSQLTQEQLSHMVFPLGDMKKADVITLAGKLNIPLPDAYQESQDVCFYPEKEPQAFLKRHLNLRSGDIIDTVGKKRGEHEGVALYTEGQRKGLGIGGLKIPLHVVRKEIKTNCLIVGERADAMSSKIIATDVNWIVQPIDIDQDYIFDVRICSQGKRIQSKVRFDGQKLFVVLGESRIGVSPGQYVALYTGTEIVGSGMIMP